MTRSSTRKSPYAKFKVGHIPGYPVGFRFLKRMDLAQAGVHRVVRAGIHGDSKTGAYSICLSGGYEDDKDYGDRIIYVGSGGRDARTKKQTGDQLETHFGNKSLIVSHAQRQPVRVVRGWQSESPHAPGWGYRYDGLYVVESYTRKSGREGFEMYFFDLRRIREEGEGNGQEEGNVSSSADLDDNEVDDDRRPG